MISYAQNGEDVLLNRLFQGQPRGFYVDIGANDPVHYSVTKHFYDHGWRGINIEPSVASFRTFPLLRPEDENLNLGISDRDGSLTFYEFSGKHSVFSTFSAEEMANRRQDGLTCHERKVPVTTLASVCERYVKGPIDFLTIDVEGHEKEVLAGADWKRWRPRVILIESTLPTTTTPAHHAWEPILLQGGYVYACFDGLNRYYVREENPEDADVLRVPANVCDRYVPYEYQRKVDDLEAQLRGYKWLTLGALEPLVFLGHSLRRVRRKGLRPAAHSLYQRFVANGGGLCCIQVG